MALMRAGTGILTRYVSSQTLLRWLISGGLVALVLLALPSTPPWCLWAGIALAGLSFSGVWPLLVSQGNARYPAYSGTAVTVLVASGTAGAMVVPVSLGFVFTHSSTPVAILLLTILFAMLYVTVWISRKF